MVSLNFKDGTLKTSELFQALLKLIKIVFSVHFVAGSNKLFQITDMLHDFNKMMFRVRQVENWILQFNILFTMLWYNIVLMFVISLVNGTNQVRHKVLQVLLNFVEVIDSVNIVDRTNQALEAFNTLFQALPSFVVTVQDWMVHLFENFCSSDDLLETMLVIRQLQNRTHELFNLLSMFDDFLEAMFSVNLKHRSIEILDSLHIPHHLHITVSRRIWKIGRSLQILEAFKYL